MVHAVIGPCSSLQAYGHQPLGWTPGRRHASMWLDLSSDFFIHQSTLHLMKLVDSPLSEWHRMTLERYLWVDLWIYIYILYIYDSLWSSPKFRELLQDGSRMYLITCNNRWQDNRYRSSLWFHHVSCGQAVHRMLKGPVEFQRRSMVAQAESSFWFGEFCHALAHRSTGPSHGAHHSRVPQLENWQSTAS